MKRKYKCSGCGKLRECLLETNQSKNPLFDQLENLKCVLDETNTSFSWVEEKESKK